MFHPSVLAQLLHITLVLVKCIHQTSATQIWHFNSIPLLQSQFDAHIKWKGGPLHSTSAW